MLVRKISAVALALVCLAACTDEGDRSTAYLDSAEAYLEADDLRRAKLDAKNAVQITPKNADARMLLARIAKAESNGPDAYTNLLIAIESEPERLDARLMMGELLVNSRIYGEAKTHVDAAIRLAPEDSNVRLLNARYLFGTDETARGEEQLLKALNLNPDNVQAVLIQSRYLGAVENDSESALSLLNDAISRVSSDDAKSLRREVMGLLVRQDRSAEAIEMARQLVQEYPEEVSYRYELANFYIGDDDLDAAEAVLAEILVSTPDDRTAQLAMVEFLSTYRKDFPAAEAALTSYIAENPDDAMALKVALGRLYKSESIFAKANAIYDEIAAADPRSEYGFEARNNIISRYLGNEDIDAARPLIEAVLADEPNNSVALISRAKIAYNDERYDDAIVDLRVVLRSQPESEVALILLAQSYLNRDTPVLALDAYRTLAELQPASAEIQQQMATIAAEVGDLEDAENMVRTSVELAPEDVAARRQLVDILLAQQDLDAAEKEARIFADLMGDETSAGYAQLGRVLVEQDRLDAATSAFRQALETDAADVRALEGLAQALLWDGQADAAISVLEERLATVPQDSAAAFLLASMYFQQGELDDARGLFEQAVTQEPSALRFWSGWLAANDGNLEEQQRIVALGMKELPGDDRAATLFGTILSRNGAYADAIGVYEETVALNPNAFRARNNLASILLNQRDDAASHQRALTLVEEFRGGDDPIGLDTLGWAYYRTGNIGQAVRSLERAVSIDGDNADARYHLGMAYLANANPFGAKQELQKALELAPEGFPSVEEIQVTLAELQKS